MELYICSLYIPSLRRQGQLYFRIVGELKNLFNESSGPERLPRTHGMPILIPNVVSPFS
jgi:hypothetical protein